MEGEFTTSLQQKHLLSYDIFSDFNVKLDHNMLVKKWKNKVGNENSGDWTHLLFCNPKDVPSKP